MDEDYYMILGVGQTATEEEIVKAYKRMALIYHPDKNNHPQSVEHFKKIRAAFEVLSDKVRRSTYDRWLGRRPSTSSSRPSMSQETASLDIWPALYAVGGVLVGAFLGYKAFSLASGSNNPAPESDDEE